MTIVRKNLIKARIQNAEYSSQNMAEGKKSFECRVLSFELVKGFWAEKNFFLKIFSKLPTAMLGIVILWDKAKKWL